MVIDGIDKDLLFEWSLWRLIIIDKVATLNELENEWDMDDLTRANTILDVKAQIEEIMSETEN